MRDLSTILFDLREELASIGDHLDGAAEWADTLRDIVETGGWPLRHTSIRTPEGLDEATDGAVIIDARGNAWQRHGRTWHCANPTVPDATQDGSVPLVTLPAAVVWTPSAGMP